MLIYWARTKIIHITSGRTLAKLVVRLAIQYNSRKRSRAVPKIGSKFEFFDRRSYKCTSLSRVILANLVGQDMNFTGTIEHTGL